MATIIPKPNFNAEEACITLNKAMRGAGTDERKIIEVLGGHNTDQRQIIKAQYITMYGSNLERDLMSELSGFFEKVCLDLMKPRYLIEAQALREAMKGNGTDERLLIEILCTRSGEELKLIRQIYESMYGPLDKHLEDETSGDFRRVLRALATGNRPIDGPVDAAAAKSDAQTLYDAGEGRFGTDESEFTRLLCSKSYAHLIRVFEEYKTIAGGKELLQSVIDETSGDLRNAYETIVKCIINRPAYFAELVHGSVKGAGTKDEHLIRVIVTRAEIDLEQVKAEYQKLFKKSMLDAVGTDLSGDYKKIIVKLIQGNRQ